MAVREKTIDRFGDGSSGARVRHPGAFVENGAGDAEIEWRDGADGVEQARWCCFG